MKSKETKKIEYYTRTVWRLNYLLVSIAILLMVLIGGIVVLFLFVLSLLRMFA